MFELRAENLDFLDTAPVRLSYSTTMKAPAKAVFEALADDAAGWTSWFGAVKVNEYGGETPYGVGTPRRVLLHGGVSFHETVIAWDSPTRYAYRIDRTTAPGLRGFVEEWSLLETPDGTRVTWTMGVDATLPVRVGLRAGSAGMGIAFRRAVAVLDRRLAAGG
jgi:Polyketide cyclase / dehydrase and lipid transport